MGSLLINYLIIPILCINNILIIIYNIILCCIYVVHLCCDIHESNKQRGVANLFMQMGTLYIEIEEYPFD